MNTSKPSEITVIQRVQADEAIAKVLPDAGCQSLHRMLSPTGNPSMDNLAAIFRAVRERLHASLTAHSVAT